MKRKKRFSLSLLRTSKREKERPRDFPLRNLDPRIYGFNRIQSIFRCEDLMKIKLFCYLREEQFGWEMREKRIRNNFEIIMK